MSVKRLPPVRIVGEWWSRIANTGSSGEAEVHEHGRHAKRRQLPCECNAVRKLVVPILMNRNPGQSRLKRRARFIDGKSDPLVIGFACRRRVVALLLAGLAKLGYVRLGFNENESGSIVDFTTEGDVPI